MITALIITLVIALSYYGQHVGNFIINVDKVSYKRGLSLASVKPDMKTKKGLTSRLTAKPLDDANDFTYDAIDFLSLAKGVGSQNHSDSSYLAFSFFLCNSGQEQTGYFLAMSIDRSTRNIEDVIRIAIMTQETNEKPEDAVNNIRVYAKAGIDDKPEPIYATDGLETRGDTIPFWGNTSDGNYAVQLFQDDFQVNQVTKYTVVMWLEGWDAQCTDDVLGGAIKLSMVFTTT